MSLSEQVDDNVASSVKSGGTRQPSIGSRNTGRNVTELETASSSSTKKSSTVNQNMPDKNQEQTSQKNPSSPPTNAKKKDDGQDKNVSKNKNVENVCDIAKIAIHSVDDKNSRSMQELSKAYQHSRTCEICGEMLGQFLVDLVTQLGVKLPKLKNEEDGNNYKGQPSDLVTADVGPGTVGWEKSKGKFEPTVESLEFTVDGLQTKCRLKDKLINRLADELRYLAECTGRTDRLLESLNLYGAGTAPDYDRATLCNHLLGKPQSSLSNDQDMEFAATNPLGLRVVRQVGPDSLLIEWDLPPPEANVNSYEIFIDGLLIQRIRSSTRTKALLHPVDFKITNKIFITLNTLDYTGEYCDSYNIKYP